MWFNYDIAYLQQDRAKHLVDIDIMLNAWHSDYMPLHSDGNNVEIGISKSKLVWIRGTIIRKMLSVEIGRVFLNST